MLNPEKAAEAIPEFQKGMKATIASPNLEDLGKVKQILLNQADVNATTNNYWLGILNQWDRYGLDMHSNYKATVEAITPKSLST